MSPLPYRTALLCGRFCAPVDTRLFGSIAGPASYVINFPHCSLLSDRHRRFPLFSVGQDGIGARSWDGLKYARHVIVEYQDFSVL